MVLVTAAVRHRATDGVEKLFQGSLRLKHYATHIEINACGERFNLGAEDWTWQSKNLRSNNIRTRVVVIQCAGMTSWLRITCKVANDDYGKAVVAFFERVAPERRVQEI